MALNNNENTENSLSESNQDNKNDQGEKSDKSQFQPPPQQQQQQRKRLFSKELRCMMYGFGDDQNPYTETVDMLEDIVISFIGHISLEAMEIGRSGRVTVEDVMYLVRHDQRKYARVKDLLSMNEELKRARKAFDEIEYVQKKKKLSSSTNPNANNNKNTSSSGTASSSNNENSSSSNQFKSLGPLITNSSSSMIVNSHNSN